MDLESRACLAILLAMFFVTSVSNTSIGVLMYRFKKLRTVPNILILSSCIADILNQIFNIPGFAAGYFAKDNKYYVGRGLALALSTFHLFFVLLNLMSMTLMMVDRLCAFKFDIAYRVWRTKSKAFKVIAAKWISCLVISMVLLVPIWDVDLGKAAINEYRFAYFSKRGMVTTVFMLPLFIIINAVVAILTCSAIKRQNKIIAKEMNMNQSTLSHARRLSEVNAIKTIGVSVMVYFGCYIPSTIYGTLNRMDAVSEYTYENVSWFGFAAYSFLFIPGVLNPFIYAIRTRRFRRALKCFLKDPFGSSELIQ